MDWLRQVDSIYWFYNSGLRLAKLGFALTFCVTACHSPQHAKIAVILQTERTIPSESEHLEVEAAAEESGMSVDLSAPTREDGIEAQAALVDDVAEGKYQGLILAPDQALSLIAPVRRVLSHSIPTVIIDSALPIPPGKSLSYVVNDDVDGGRLAAQRIAFLLHDRGKIAILGIDPDFTGVLIRAHALEESLAQNEPNIHIVEKRFGSFNVEHEEQVAEDTLKAHPDLDVIVALGSTTTDGTLSALCVSREKHLRVIGFDSAEVIPFGQTMPAEYRDPSLDCVFQSLDSVIQADTGAMGRQAIELLHDKLLGRSVPTLIKIEPKLITRDNINTAEIQQMLTMGPHNRRVGWIPIQ
jgi:ribose transport system substrate-binding protein